MPIDPDKALGATLGPVHATWTPDDVILYHLGLGAGDPPTDTNELEYTYEDGLKVLPSYLVLPVFPALAGVTDLPGLEFDPTMMLHGEQDLQVHAVPPTSGQVTSEGRIAEIYDKGKAALVVLEMVTRDDSGADLATNRFSLFLRGEGGFGGDPGPRPSNDAPEREPDLLIESPTLPQQALLYRLSGDKNPLHADPTFAQQGGFDQPILHGLCTYGVVCKAVVDHALDGDASRVGRYRARFAGVVLPGETIITSVWRDGNTLLLSATAKERAVTVMSNAAISLR